MSGDRCTRGDHESQVIIGTILRALPVLAVLSTITLVDMAGRVYLASVYSDTARTPVIDRTGLDRSPETPALVENPPSPSSSRVVLDSPVDDVTVTFEYVIEGDAAESLWEAYRLNFEPLEELAILQHMYSRDEVMAELANPDIVKIVGWQNRTPVGLGMVTNHLESVPQISPRYLRAKYPEHASADRIYFGILVAVSPSQRGMTLFNRIYLEMWNIPAKERGILVFDICEFNRVAFDTDSLVRRIGSNFSGAKVETIDRQTWYAAELPNPLAGT